MKTIAELIINSFTFDCIAVTPPRICYITPKVSFINSGIISPDPLKKVYRGSSIVNGRYRNQDITV